MQHPQLVRKYIFYLLFVHCDKIAVSQLEFHCWEEGVEDGAQLYMRGREKCIVSRCRAHHTVPPGFYQTSNILEHCFIWSDLYRLMYCRLFISLSAQI